jgi:5,5'-dehydrodivanillate O-demethylase oxygenase subunit
MITEEENKRLTQVGPGTPMGELLRRYWQPILPKADLERDQVVPIRLLGENLVLYKNLRGEMGLIQERCPHRSASLAYGLPDDDGIRCPYHGWKFGSDGACLDQPFEETVGNTKFKDHIRIAAYPVEELCGLIFAYLGPQPAPLLPRWEPLVNEDQIRGITVRDMPINWLEAKENNLDPMHFDYLHVAQGNYWADRLGKPQFMRPIKHLDIAFDIYEFGIIKRRLLEGEDPETSVDWNVGHPALFPNASGGGGLGWTVPLDDTHTRSIGLQTRDRLPEESPQTIEEIPIRTNSYQYPDGTYKVDQFTGQDPLAFVTQGAIAPRQLENLGRSDAGILLYRNWLHANMDKVARGEDPDGLVRDPAKNEPYIPVPGTGNHRLAAARPVELEESKNPLVSAGAAWFSMLVDPDKQSLTSS